MHGVLAVKRTILAQLKLCLGILAVLLGSIVLPLAFRTLHSDDFNRCLLGHNRPLL